MTALVRELDVALGSNNQGIMRFFGDHSEADVYKSVQGRVGDLMNLASSVIGQAL